MDVALASPLLFVSVDNPRLHCKGAPNAIRLRDLNLLPSIQSLHCGLSFSTTWKLRVPHVNASGNDQKSARKRHKRALASSKTLTSQPALDEPSELSDNGVNDPPCPDAMAADAAGAEAIMEHDELQEKIASGLSFVMQAQHFLNVTPMPSGFEALCLKASTHYLTLFDHFQRELQNALGKLQEEGVIESWKEAKAWQLLKLHVKSGMAINEDGLPNQIKLSSELGSDDLWSSLSSFMDDEGRKPLGASAASQSLMGLSTSLFNDSNSFVMDKEDPPELGAEYTVRKCTLRVERSATRTHGENQSGQQAFGSMEFCK